MSKIYYSIWSQGNTLIFNTLWLTFKFNFSPVDFMKILVPLTHFWKGELRKEFFIVSFLFPNIWLYFDLYKFWVILCTSVFRYRFCLLSTHSCVVFAGCSGPFRHVVVFVQGFSLFVWLRRHQDNDPKVSPEVSDIGLTTCV